MKICLIEPFYSGSHATWADEYQRYSRHEVKLLTLRGRHWKWRMHGGAVTLARHFMADSVKPDLLLATDMLDLTSFLALTRQKTAAIPAVLYCHENQLTYPWSPEDRDTEEQRDAHYAFINFSSALAANLVLFNSQYHLNIWHEQLPSFLKSFPDENEIESLSLLKDKCRVLHLGLDLQRLDQHRPQAQRKKDRLPLILWNHRWEYDKNPAEFFQALYDLQMEGIPFEVAVLGESFQKSPAVFSEARQRLGKRIVQFGYVDNIADYARWLWQADILPVTSRHDFFGASVIQAIYCQCTPLLPNRLAYPEHLPVALWQDFMYDGYDNFLRQLRRLLKNPHRDNNALRTHVVRYDWQNLAKDYDNLFEELVLKGQAGSTD